MSVPLKVGGWVYYRSSRDASCYWLHKFS